MDDYVAKPIRLKTLKRRWTAVCIRRLRRAMTCQPQKSKVGKESSELSGYPAMVAHPAAGQP